MNRTYALIILLIMFLSCGNSSLDHSDMAKIPFSHGNISKEQKIMAEKLDTFFTDLYKKKMFNGCILVSKAGTIIYQKSLGLLDKTANIPLTDSSMFQLASVSKVITATAVLMLHEREMLDIEKPLSDYFPDFPYQDVRIKDLLNHRSGLPNYIYTLGKEICKPDYKMSNQDMYTCFVSQKASPYLKPDKRFNYCNTNYALLALLVEKVSGKSFQDFLRQELFNPLGMKNTATILDVDLAGTNITRPYDTRWKPITFDASDYVLGDKSIYSTAYDLYLFSEALYQNKIIKPNTQELAYTAFSKEKKLSNYGYGWRLKNFNDPDKKEVYHNGWWHGYRSSFHRRLKDSLTVVILSNQLNRSAYQTHKVYEILDNVVSTDTLDEDDE
jgi:CubicO group peptidase (beta-lactamase class C family)